MIIQPLSTDLLCDSSDTLLNVALVLPCSHCFDLFYHPRTQKKATFPPTAAASRILTQKSGSTPKQGPRPITLICRRSRLERSLICPQRISEALPHLLLCSYHFIKSYDILFWNQTPSLTITKITEPYSDNNNSP